MANVLSKSSIEMTVTLVLSEAEARALEAMTSYGAAAFLQGYYKHLGKCYMQPHEAGIRTLFKSINTQLPPHIKRADKAREVFNAA